jgi:hypothetical protein
VKWAFFANASSGLLPDVPDDGLGACLYLNALDTDDLRISVL